MNTKTVAITGNGARFADVILPLTRRQTDLAWLDGGDGRVQIGFRPEDCDLVGPYDGGLPIQIDLVEQLGSDAFIYGHLAMEGQTEQFVVRTGSRHAPAIRDVVYLLPKSGRHHAFHARTGHTLG